MRRSLTVTGTSNWPDHAYKAVFGDPNNPNSTDRRGWNDSTVLALNLTNGSSDASYRSSCPTISGAVRVCNYTYGANGWLGLAQINADANNHITWATTKLNDSYFNSGSYPVTEQRHVACQEIGHDFGLGHTSENGSSQNTCMDYYRNTSSSDWTSTGPNQHDFDQLLVQHHATEIRNPAYTFLADVSTALAEDDEQLTEPWQWGTPFEFDREGRASGFELNLGDRVVFTFVRWALPEGRDGGARSRQK